MHTRRWQAPSLLPPGKHLCGTKPDPEEATGHGLRCALLLASSEQPGPVLPTLASPVWESLDFPSPLSQLGLSFLRLPSKGPLTQSVGMNRF